MVPIGGIIAWSGAIVNIPNHYQLCDGSNGTPDLRNKFLVGAGDAYNPDAEGGAETHTHAFTGDGHSHDPANTHDASGVGAVQNWNGSAPSTTDAASGTTDAGSSLPPYFALAYIQRMT